MLVVRRVLPPSPKTPGPYPWNPVQTLQMRWRISRWRDYLGLARWTLNTTTCILIKGRWKCFTHTHKWGDVKMEQRQVWRCWPWRLEWHGHSQGALAATRAGRGMKPFSPGGSGGSTALLIPGVQLTRAHLGLLVSWNVRIIPGLLSLRFLVICSSSHRKLIQYLC